MDNLVYIYKINVTQWPVGGGPKDNKENKPIIENKYILIEDISKLDLKKQNGIYLFDGEKILWSTPYHIGFELFCITRDGKEPSINFKVPQEIPQYNRIYSTDGNHRITVRHDLEKKEISDIIRGIWSNSFPKEFKL